MEDKLFPVPKTIDNERFPNTVKYIMLHGTLECMSKWDLKAPFKDCEEVYAECLKKGVTWKELLDFKGYSEEILL